jgi:hypothetical protein
MDMQQTGKPAMRHAYALALGGALFKKKVKENGHDGDSKSREKAIRDKVVDDLRGREDTLREREAALAAREEEHGKKSAELAHKLQELAVRETELKSKYGDGGAPAKAAAHHELPPDSDKVEEQEKLVSALERRLAGARARHEELRRSGTGRRLSDTISAYHSSGYIVSRLEKLKDLPTAELDKALAKFEKDAAALGPLAARCDGLDRAVAKEAEALRSRCNDPDAIAEIERGIKELETRIEARRAELRKRVDRWKHEGFSTARFARLTDTGLGALEEAAAKFEEDIEVLRMFREKLGALDDPARKDADRLAPFLNDPDNIPALEKEFLELEKQAGVRRQAFLELFEKWRSEGFRVEPLEKALSADLPKMRAAFLKFDEDVRRLRALSGRASSLDVSFATQVAGLNRGLHDPEQLEKMEIAVKELEEEAAIGKAASAGRSHAPAPKVVSTRRTAARAAEAVEKTPPAPEAPKAPAGERPVPAARAPAEEAPPKAPAPAPPAPAPHHAPAPSHSEPPKAAAGPAPAAGGPESEVAAEMAAAEAIIKELEAKKVDPSAAANLLKLGKSFNRSKNYAKALQYARKAKETAAAMRK